MKPHALLAACSLLAPPALAAASDYPPPMGPYRTPATLESLAEQARAILDALGPSDSEPTPRPDGRYADSTRTFTLDRADAKVRQPPRSGPVPTIGYGAPERASIAPPARRTAWNQEGPAATARELPAFSQYGPAYDSADSWVPPQPGADSQQRYAQAPTPDWRPAADPYAADRYRGPTQNAGSYRPTPAGQLYQEAASVPNQRYTKEAYREPVPVARQYGRKASPDAWPYYAGGEPPTSPPSPDYYRQPSQPREPYPATPELGAYSMPPPIAAPQPDTGAYDPETLLPGYPGMTGGTGAYSYGVDPYAGSYQEADPYRQGQPTYPQDYANAPAQLPLTPPPAHKASYSRDVWPSNSVYTPEDAGRAAGAGAYGRMRQEHNWDYDAEYRRGYTAPADAHPLTRSPHNEPASPSFRYRALEPSSDKLYYGDYEFAPLPNAPRELSRQTVPGQSSNAKGWYGGGDTQPASGQFRGAGALPSSVTDSQGQVYRYRPMEEQHSSAPNARTWKPGSYGGPQDYPKNQSRPYPEDRPAGYPAPW